MKKIVLFLIVSFFGGLNALHAQCTPDTSVNQLIYPDSATGLIHAKVGAAYSAVIQVKVPPDTLLFGSRLPIDSIVLNSVTGLPYHFTFTCTPASCSLPGGSHGCALLYSTTDPVDSMIGSHQLSINITAYVKFLGSEVPAPSSVNYYKLIVDSGNVGFAVLNNAKFDLSQNFPDPANKVTDIYYNVPSAMMLEFKVYNLLGKTVYQKSFFAERGKGRITLDARDYAPGIYLYNLSNGKTTLTKRMVMANN